MTEVVMLTEELREKILKAIREEHTVIDAMQDNIFAAMKRAQLHAAEYLFRALPEGYPIPIEKGWYKD